MIVATGQFSAVIPGFIPGTYVSAGFGVF